jgi:hypothetical protein
VGEPEADRSDADISTRVNKPENDDPSIVEPVELATDVTAGARRGSNLVGTHTCSFVAIAAIQEPNPLSRHSS